MKTIVKKNFSMKSSGFRATRNTGPVSTFNSISIVIRLSLVNIDGGVSTGMYVWRSLGDYKTLTKPSAFPVAWNLIRKERLFYIVYASKRQWANTHDETIRYTRVCVCIIYRTVCVTS